MPSTATITSFYSFVPKTRIESAKVNNNFSVFRGHLIPVDPTATSSPNMTYDLGADTHAWRGIYSQYGIMYGNTAGSVPSNPTAGSMALYFKSDGHLYKKDSSGTEVDMNASGSGGLTYIARTASYTASAQEFVNVTANTCTVTLPTAVGVSGQSIVVRNVGTAVVSILFTGGQNADGYTQIDLSNAKEEIRFTSNNANWMIDYYKFKESRALFSGGSPNVTIVASNFVRINVSATLEGGADITASQDATDGCKFICKYAGWATVYADIDTTGGNGSRLIVNGSVKESNFSTCNNGAVVEHGLIAKRFQVAVNDTIQITNAGANVDNVTGLATFSVNLEKEL